MDILENYKQLWNNWDIRILWNSWDIRILWNYWDIRILILLSLFIQVILISLGRLRKTSSSIWIQMFLWSSYLLADWVAGFVLGRLSGTMDGSSSSSNAIIAFWAPFLILHLGGPDTITAFSLEDNELWLRHLLAFCYELIAAFYVLFRSLPNTRLLAPTLLIFFVGFIKYVERTYSLYRASTKSFSRSFVSAGKLVTTSFSSTKSKIEDLKTLQEYFELYTAFKPCFVDIDIRDEELNAAESFLKDMEPREVLEVMDMELSYAYDELYTKAIVNHSRAGYVLRALCSICIWLAFFLYVFAPKVSFDKLDMAITYVLVAASVFLDATAIVMLLFSDWMVLSLLNVKKLGHWTELLAMHIVKIKSRWLKRRSWLREMPQLNLISNCLKNSATKEKNSATKEGSWRRIMNWIEEELSLVQETKLFRLSSGDNKTHTLRALQPIKATQELQEIIVAHAQRFLNRFFRESVLSSAFRHIRIPHGRDAKELRESIDIVIKIMESLSFDLKVLVWHVATELCFHWKSEYLHSPLPPQIVIETEDSKSRGVEGKTSEKDACKYLSNYMMHMVVMRPEMMSTMGRESFWSACNLMFRFIHEERGTDHQLLIPNAKVEDVCREMMTRESNIITIESELNLAQKFARNLLLIEEKQRWEIVTKMWVEILIKGGKVSRANMHLKQLSKGGEPLTFIWLLTKHWGE